VKKLLNVLYNFLIGLFWIATFGFGSTAVVSIIYICYREFGRAKTFGIYCGLFLVAGVVFVVLGMGIDVLEAKLKIRRW